MKFSIIYFWLIIFKAHFYLGFQFNSALFEIKNYQIINYSWLIASIEFKGVDIFKCLQECNLNYYCSYVEHNSTNCNMFSEYVSGFFVNSSLNLIFKKVKFSIEFPNCSNADEIWSLSSRKCLKCPSGFTKRLGFPHACYRLLNSTNNYDLAKSYCQQVGGFLPRPKTFFERNLLSKWIVTQGIWLDPRISKINETFTWSDGTKVGGFYPGEPNNQNSKTILKDYLLALWNDLIYDTDQSLARAVVCQYN
ncbi:unnamed protein product [Brachionus calyciflorus]|uniref:C-type lectin domain-containing protein n=1 Tax=Brachionus calyciflorus TaxID=104777 RepID=A0A813TLB2_9BILA|nr:unnamed protein product [Brachionus calyciflorus]